MEFEQFFKTLTAQIINEEYKLNEIHMEMIAGSFSSSSYNKQVIRTSLIPISLKFYEDTILSALVYIERLADSNALTLYRNKMKKDIVSTFEAYANEVKNVIGQKILDISNKHLKDNPVNPNYSRPSFILCEFKSKTNRPDFLYKVRLIAILNKIKKESWRSHPFYRILVGTVPVIIGAVLGYIFSLSHPN